LSNIHDHWCHVAHHVAHHLDHVETLGSIMQLSSQALYIYIYNHFEDTLRSYVVVVINVIRSVR